MNIRVQFNKMCATIKSALIMDANCQQLGSYLAANKKPVTHSDVILIQATEDTFYLGLLGVIAQVAQSRYGLAIHYYLSRSLNVGESASLERWFKSRFFHNLLWNKKWRTIYQVFCEKEAFAGVGIHPVFDVSDFLRAKKIHQSITSKEMLVELSIDDIVVGDLIYDCYLRFKPAPTLDVKDIYLLVLLWEALRLLRRSKSYFSLHKPLMYLTGHSVYIQNGIPVRIALAQGIKVLSFADLPVLYKIQTTDDMLHMRNTDHYAREFAALDNQEEKLAMAEIALQKRLGGGIDVATTYMRQSAYSETVTDVPDVKGHVIIFLHDFYDGIHIYKGIIFADFWEWAAFTIDILTRLGIPFSVKPHPNQIGESAVALDLFIERYPGLKVLNPKITNKQLVAAGMACAVTVYGTIGHEMAFMGIPTITCAHHPHNSFDFCYNGKTLEEYAALLARAENLPFDKEAMRKQSLAFYFMHNLHKTEGEREMMALINSVRFKGGDTSINMMQAMLQLKAMPEFQRQISEIFSVCEIG